MAQTRGVLRIAGVFGRFGMQGEQKGREARVFAHEQAVNARILEKLHGQALEGAPVVGDLRRRPAAVAGHVRQCGAVAVDAADAVTGVVHVGQAHAEAVVVGHDLPQCVISV